MVENVISFVGAFLKHVIGVVMLCWRRMLRAGVIAFGIGVVLVLLVAVISTGQAFPGELALVVALIFGAALAYGVALTVFVEEFLLGIVDLIRLLEGDVKAAAHITATVAEREVGEVTQGLRRLVGLPVSSRVRRAASAAAMPTLPTLPKYPATSPRPAATSARPASQAIDAAAVAGAAALAASAATRGAMPAATPPPAMPSSAPASTPLDEGHDVTTPVGEPVRADRLPRIGWTYEHEAIRPTRVASPAAPTTQASDESDTLAELAGAASVAGVVAGASHLAATSAAESPSEPSVEVAPIPTEAAPASEPLDVTVIPATPSRGLGAVAPAEALEDAPPLEDERLAEPVAFDLPVSEPLAPPTEEQPLIPPTEAAPIESPSLDPAMLTPAPATIPLAPEEPLLDPAMLAPAPATTPLPQEEEPQPVEPPVDVTPAVAAPVDDEAPTLPEIPLAAAPVEPTTPEPETAPEQPVDEEAAPPARSSFSRITRPVEDLGTALDALNRTRTHSGPRASAPESGLWERLSQALIDRSGIPSNPFAAPQTARPTQPESIDTSDASDANESDGTPQG